MRNVENCDLTFEGFRLMDILLVAAVKNFSNPWSLGGGGGMITFGIGESPEMLIR